MRALIEAAQAVVDKIGEGGEDKGCDFCDNGRAYHGGKGYHSLDCLARHLQAEIERATPITDGESS